MATDDPALLTASEAAQRIAGGELTAVALAEACLARIAAREDLVGAFEYLDKDQVLSQARACDRSSPRGPLHGVPIAVKDLLDTEDMPTTYGSPIYRGHRPTRDAAAVATVRGAGAVILGKTVTTEFAHTKPGRTTNPHDPARTPGGSSSGSAAAVAAFMAPLAFGTQTGGSVIRPASFCGLYGSKPTRGRVDLAGVKELAGSFDTVGWFARSAEDLALMGRLLLLPRWDDAKSKAPQRPRIALCRTPYWAEAQPESRAAVESAAQRLAERGAEILPLELPADFAALQPTHRVIGADDATRAFRHEYENHRALLSDAIRTVIETGLAQDPSRVAEARALAELSRKTLDRIMQHYDAVLAPSAPGEAPLGIESTGNAIFSAFWSLLETPCVTLPYARGPHGMPVGVQLVGSRGGDEALLALAEWAALRLID
ncbi:MAG: amidase [Alphaproteobacteria bacterium]|nr:amidase [Alphaproteobacteria bacterium]